MLEKEEGLNGNTAASQRPKSVEANLDPLSRAKVDQSSPRPNFRRKIFFSNELVFDALDRAFAGFSPVHGDDLPGNIARQSRAEEYNRARNFFRRGNAP